MTVLLVCGRFAGKNAIGGTARRCLFHEEGGDPDQKCPGICDREGCTDEAFESEVDTGGSVFCRVDLVVEHLKEAFHAGELPAVFARFEQWIEVYGKRCTDAARDPREKPPL